MERYACKVPELKCVENKDSDTTLDECNKYCKPSKLPKGVTTSFAYSPFMYFFNSAIKYESKLQYPFPKEYGYILEDPEYIELPTGINEHAVNKLRTEFHDIYKNKSYVFANVLGIIAEYSNRGLHALDSIYTKGAIYSDISINKTVTTDWKDEYKSRIIVPDDYEPGSIYNFVYMNKELEDILYSREHTYTVTSDSSFLKNLRSALGSEEISVFDITKYNKGSYHANAIIVHPKLNNIYYIEPHGSKMVDTYFTDKLKIITDSHGVWNWKFNYQIQADDHFCASWVKLCVAMIAVNPYKDGIELISLLMLDEYESYSLRHTILVLWLYYVREKLTQGTRAIKHYIDPNYKHMVVGEYKSHYSVLTDEEIERKYNDDIPLLREILEILNENSLGDSNAIFTIDNINTRFASKSGCILL